MDMPASRRTSLLAEDEPPVFRIDNAAGASPFFLTCDHAGRRIPRSLGDLGLAAEEFDRHIAWDIGAAGVSSALAARLDAVAIVQNYSRLVIDCNRPLESPTLIAQRSEQTDIPGNANLTSAERQRRIDEIFVPYHARIENELDARRAAGRPTILVTVHSFTPVYLGVARPWQVGVLYHNGEPRLARALLDVIRDDGRWVVGDNEPYSVNDASDYAIPVHGVRRGLANVELEIRQDLIADVASQAQWAERVAGWLRGAASVARLP